MADGSREFVLATGAEASPEAIPTLANGAAKGFRWTDDGPARRTRRTWLDTFDWRLYRAGLSLEHQAGRAGAELVLTDRDGERLASQPLAAGGRGNGIDWPRLPADLPAGPLRELVERVAGIRALAPVAKAISQVSHRRVLNSDDKTVARLEIDRMSVSYPAKALAQPRLSVSAVRGYQGQALRLSDALARAAGVGSGDRTALETVLAATGSKPAPRAAAVQLTAAMPAATAMGAILTGFLDAIELNVPGTIRDVDTEFLHDLRIGVRRTRSALKLAGRALPDDLAARYAPEFRWLGDLTTPTRDLDVYLLEYPRMTRELVGASEDELLPLREYLEKARAVAQRGLARGLRSARFTRMTQQWRADLEAIQPVRKRPTVGQLAGRQIAVAQRRALRDGSRITAASPPQDLHDLRKRCKELRYLVEMFGSLHDPAQRWQAVRELKALQDCLGAFQDAEVQRAEIRSFADQMLIERSAPAATLLAMGEIAAGLARRQNKARADFDGRFAAFASPVSQSRLAALTRTSTG